MLLLPLLGSLALTSLLQKQGGTDPVLRNVPVSDAQLLGTYYMGDGLGMNCTLELMAHNRFKFRWTGCLGEYGKNEGLWQVKGDMVYCDPTMPNKETFGGMNIRFVPVIWAKRLYLVDEYEAPGFCSALEKGKPVTGLDEIHGMSYVLLCKDFKAQRIALPDFVPQRFKSFVGQPPILCKITRIGPDGKVVLDKGSANGLRAGLMLTTDNFGGSVNLEVVQVARTSCVAVPGYFPYSDRLPRVGDKFHTGGQYNQPEGTGAIRLPRLPSKGPTSAYKKPRTEKARLGP